MGYVPDHKRPNKRKRMNQTWFPKSWTENDIKRAGEHVSGLRKNRHVSNGVTVFVVYKGVALV